MHRMSLGMTPMPQKEGKEVRDGAQTKGVELASVIVDMLRDDVDLGEGLLIGVLSCASPKPGLTFVSKFPSLKNIEGGAVAAASKKRFRARGREDRG